MAKSHGVILEGVTGSGPRGRIKAKDIQAHVLPPEPALEATAPAAVSAQTRPATNFEKTVARRLTEAKATIPHFYVMAEADVTELLSIRTQLNAAGAARKISLNHLVVLAAGRALLLHPEVATLWDGGSIVSLANSHVGIAVDTPRGLFAPVLPDVGGLRVDALAEAADAAAARAREGTLRGGELAGGALTVSNVGMFGAAWLIPIINPGQAAIVGVGAAKARFEPDREGQPVLRQILTLTFSGDHRVLDGVKGARFLNTIVRLLEQPGDPIALRNYVRMDFTLTDEQHMIVETARRVGAQFGLDYWRELDAKCAYPSELWAEICKSGLCGVAVPERFGGAGLGMFELALVVQTVCAAGGGSTLSQLFMVNPIFGGISLSKYGTPAQQALLPKLVSGEVAFCMALTEPDAGSNALAITTFAESDGDGWRLNGRKIWITSVPQSSKMLVVARTKRAADVGRKTDGISLFLIDTDREGLTHAKIDKVGTRTLPSSTVFFDDVRIAPDELVGSLHNGWPQLLEVLNTERIVTTAGLLGTAELAIRLSVDYARDRKVFGDRPIGSYQALQFPLAEAHIQTECARLMNFQAATLHDQGKPYGSASNQAKWLAGHAAALATDRAIQTMGGMGYACEYHVERLWRDARLFRVAPVSEEMVLNYVAQHDLGLPRSY